MTSRIVLLVSFACLAAGQPVVSHIRLDDLGHSSVRVTWGCDRRSIEPADSVRPDSCLWKDPVRLLDLCRVALGCEPNVDSRRPGSGLRTIHLCPQSQNADGWSSCRGSWIRRLLLPLCHRLIRFPRLCLLRSPSTRAGDSRLHKADSQQSGNSPDPDQHGGSGSGQNLLCHHRDHWHGFARTSAGPSRGGRRHDRLLEALRRTPLPSHRR